ncbi:MAG: TlpA family protein disulfide reductase [Pyrinomonadaceae bacterium]|nr:TlpA family protein disulfide reductase [Pyrinomonadaceae bacterium]
MPNLAEYMMKNKLLVLTFSIILVLSGTVVAQTQTANLQTLDGEVVTLPALKGKVVVLAIGASWLPLSKQQIITTNKLAKKYAGKDVVIYWVTTDSNNAKSKNYASDEQIKAFGVKNKMASTILRDSDGLFTLKKYNVDQLPSFVILDKTGKSIGEPFSGLDPDNEVEFYGQLTGAIDKIL